MNSNVQLSESNTPELKDLATSADLCEREVAASPQMDFAIKLELPDAVQRLVNGRETSFVSLLFASLMILQTACYLILGTDRGRGASAFLEVVCNVLAMVCAYAAQRRSSGLARLYWFLFNAALFALLIPTVLLAYGVLFHQYPFSDSTWRLLFCLYGAPVMMMLFLPDIQRSNQLKAEIALDLFQVGVVVALIYSTFFFLPVQTMDPGEAFVRNLIVSNLHTLFLLLAATVRLSFARDRAARSRLLRLAVFLLFCVIATYVGDWIDQHHNAAASAWFDLGWDIPCVVAGLVALTWRPSTEPAPKAEPKTFVDFLTTNLVLVAMLAGMHFLMDSWKAANGAALTNIAVVVMLGAFIIRLALTQYSQQQEIAHRQAAQAQLLVANDKVRILLEDARCQTREITQVSELASLLQACASREEVFRILPERLRALFPESSGAISMLSASKNRAEAVAEWGPIPPADQIFSPDECWALRRGCTHAHSLGEPNTLRCSHLSGDGSSVCIPLIANGDTIGTLAIQEATSPAGTKVETINAIFSWRRQLAAAIAEHIAVAVANLSLREALRVQAVRDPLTGLYNRRYMEEFLDRELHRALRKRRPVAVMMLDLDHFKRYNDTHGHAAGDRALAAVGETLLRSMRAEDVACRYGGEEFAIILSECTLAQATIRANEIRQRVKEYRFQNEDQVKEPLNVSIGVAAFDETTDRIDLLLKFADEALYQAKRSGRDCVVPAKPAATQPEAESEAVAPAKVLTKVLTTTT